MRKDLISSKSAARLAQTILQALNPSYAEHSPVASIDRGVFNSATWGASPEAIPDLIYGIFRIAMITWPDALVSGTALLKVFVAS